MARTRERTTAGTALARLQAIASGAQSHWGLGLAARANALLSSGRVAAGEFERSIDHLGRTRVVMQLARTRLLYGEWLRRARQPAEARRQLTAACEIFESSGARSFTGRALAELRATESPGRRSAPDGEQHLTGRELTVARMAAAGHSNRAIAQHLFISEKTVEYHLGKVFAKLKVRSRTQLPSLLGELPEREVPDREIPR